VKGKEERGKRAKSLYVEYILHFRKVRLKKKVEGFVKGHVANK
jgi:hypothetical protein